MQTNPELTMMIHRSMQVVDRDEAHARRHRRPVPGLLAQVRVDLGQFLIAIGSRIAPVTDRGAGIPAIGAGPKFGRADI